MLNPYLPRRRKEMTIEKRLQSAIGIIVFLGLVMMIGSFGFLFNFRSNFGIRGRVWVTMNTQPFNEDQLAYKAKNLIIVAGHSVIVSGNLEKAGTDESVWWLLDYQRGRGMPQAILGHIEAGIREASHDSDALLIFSGGVTRPFTGPLSEGASYFQVADAMNLWPQGNSVRARTIAEEFATDSFENL
jgi:hypothetical protein